jgi:hypothetical protein
LTLYKELLPALADTFRTNFSGNSGTLLVLRFRCTLAVPDGVKALPR